MQIPKELKNQMIVYVKEYSKRILNSKNQAAMLNAFDSRAAAQAVINSLRKKDQFKDLKILMDDQFYNYLIHFFDEKLPINYLALKRGIGYYETKSLLMDKGTDFFPELKGLNSHLFKEKNNDYPATKKQIQCILTYEVCLNHVHELSGREASLIISCLKLPTKTRPAYFGYYIKED